MEWKEEKMEVEEMEEEPSYQVTKTVRPTTPTTELLGIYLHALVGALFCKAIKLVGKTSCLSLF